MKCRNCKREIEDNSLFCNWCGKKQIKEKKKKISVPPPRRLASGQYTAQLMVRGQRFYVPAQDTEELYYAAATALKAELLEQEKAPCRLTLDGAIERYLTDSEGVLSPSTMRGYKTIQRQLKKYSDVSCDALNYQKMISELSKAYNAKTVKNMWGLVCRALKNADIAVPAKINLPQRVKKEHEFLDYGQIKTFLTAIEGKECELPALLALHSLRRSEIFALTAESIEEGVIHVRGATVYDEVNCIVRKDTNKTVDSARDIPVVIPRLNELAGQLPLNCNLNTPWRQINKVCEDNGLPQIGLHGLRHSFMSLCWHLGIDIKSAMLYGGWASPDVPTKIYAHLATSDAEKDMKKMADFYQK